MAQCPVLSVVVPAFNERRTIAAVLPPVARSLPEVGKEIIIVDDASTDGTREWLLEQVGTAGLTGNHLVVDAHDGLQITNQDSASPASLSVRAVFRDRNGGKGAALRSGFAHVSGDVVVVQDADLEYRPADWARMWPLIAEDDCADVVYGSRFYGYPHRSLYFHHYAGNRLISRVFNVLYDQTLSDVEVGYKMMRREVLESLRLSKDDFGVELEISAQIALARRWRIYELGVHYFGRTYEEGKKITWKDGLKALYYLLAMRVRRLPGQ